MRFDAILWDNDGVLVDTEHLYYQATAEVMAEVGVALDDETYREFFLNRATGAWHLVAERGYSEADIEAFKEERNRRHDVLLEADTLAIEGAAEVLEGLAGQLRMAVVTSAWRRHFERSHRHSGMRHHFEFVLTREDYGNSKPDPEPYLLGLARIGVAPERCLVIEDTHRGLRAAKAAGLACWVIPTALSRGGDYSIADAVLTSIDEVPRRLAMGSSN